MSTRNFECEKKYSLVGSEAFRYDKLIKFNLIVVSSVAVRDVSDVCRSFSHI